MACKSVPLPGGGTAIVCGTRPRRQKCRCGRASTLLCDWKVKDRRSGTCDAPLCSHCSHNPAPDKDLCPEHAAQWKVRLKRCQPPDLHAQENANG